MKQKAIRYLRLYGMEAWFSYRALFAWQRPGPYISAKFVFPLFTMLLFIYMGQFVGIVNPVYIVIGHILLLPTTNGISGVSMTIGNERNFGTLPYLIGSPAPRGPLFLGRTLFHILDGLSTVVLALPLAILVFRLDLSQVNLFLVAGCIVLITLTSTGFGLILGSISLMTPDGWFITSTIAMALYILCGVNFPVDLLPGSLRALAYALPMTRGIQAARLALDGAGWSATATLVAGEALVGLVYALLGYILFRVIEQRSLVDGRLDTI